MPMTRLREIQDGVGAWSVKNFGDQESTQVNGLVLGALAPLMGLAEEVGELFEANQPNGDGDAVFDAVGDCVIYLCDYASRRGISISDIVDDFGVTADRYENPFRGIVVATGKLMRANLKYHQGIRNHDRAGYLAAEAVAIKSAILSLSEVARLSLSTTLINVVDQVFHRVVLKRDWVSSPDTGKA